MGRRQYSPGRQVIEPPSTGQLQRPLARHVPELPPDRQALFVLSQLQKLIVSWPQSRPF